MIDRRDSHHSGQYHFDIGDFIDPTESLRQQVSDRDQRHYSFVLNQVGFGHIFIKTVPISNQGFVLYETPKPTIREITKDEMLNTLPAIYLALYVFPWLPYHSKFQISEDDNSCNTPLACHLELPDLPIFTSYGRYGGKPREGGRDDETLWIEFKHWNLNGDEDLPIHIPQNPEFYALKAQFIDLERPRLISRD